MPLYDYACPGCGPFSASRPLREFDQPADCPACGAPAPRRLTVPAVLGRAQRTSGRDTEPGGYRRLAHAAGCLCCPR